MKKLMDVLPLLLVVVLLFGTACQSNKKKDAESANVTLFDKDLPEIKTLVNGESVSYTHLTLPTKLEV